MNTGTISAPGGRTSADPRGTGKLLLLMAALFAMPFAVVGGLFAIDWRPARTGNHGELAAVAGGLVALPLDGLRGADGAPLPASALSGHWTLVLADGGPCGVDCEARLATVRRIHVALGKGMPRVKRVWLSPAPAADPKLALLRERYPDLVVAAPANDAWRGLHTDPAAPGVAGPRFFVVDPVGRVVLRYPEPFDPRGALRDVERLLRYSWIG